MCKERESGKGICKTLRTVERKCGHLPKNAYGYSSFTQCSSMLHLPQCLRSNGGGISWLTFILYGYGNWKQKMGICLVKHIENLI